MFLMTDNLQRSISRDHVISLAKTSLAIMEQENLCERQEFLMRRARAPSTHAAVFMETHVSVAGALGAQAPVYIDSLDRFGSITEATKQDQARYAHSHTCVSSYMHSSIFLSAPAPAHRVEAASKNHIHQHG